MASDQRSTNRAGGAYRDIVESIGNTPLVELPKLSPKPGVHIFAKLEGRNPTGSVKDRVAKSMIETAEAEGAIEPGQTILEPTSGNTGISLAMICRRKGYSLKVVMPDNVTKERTQLLEMYGAEIVYSEGAKGSNGAVEVALEMAEDSRYYMPYQYGNEANPKAHYNGTAVEILEELDEVTAFVGGLGTGGTLMGNGRRLKEHDPETLIVAAEPMQGEMVHGLRSLDDGFIPPIIDIAPARPQDHGLQPRRDRLDAQAARRGGRLRRRLLRRDRPHRRAHRRGARRRQRRLPDPRRRLEVPLLRRLHQTDRRDRQSRLDGLVVGPRLAAPMRISQALADEIVAHAREDLPNECCGMVGGGDGEARTVYRAENAEASPLRYSIDAKEQFRLMRAIEEAGEELVAIYHSHTKSAAYPSQTDVNLAGWPEAVYLIVSLADPEAPDLKGFWIKDGKIAEAELVVE